eukprot:7575387-Lingulodinium_polyedra.AAC.1
MRPPTRAPGRRPHSTAWPPSPTNNSLGAPRQPPGRNNATTPPAPAATAGPPWAGAWPRAPAREGASPHRAPAGRRDPAARGPAGARAR